MISNFLSSWFIRTFWIINVNCSILIMQNNWWEWSIDRAGCPFEVKGNKINSWQYECKFRTIGISELWVLKKASHKLLVCILWSADILLIFVLCCCLFSSPFCPSHSLKLVCSFRKHTPDKTRPNSCWFLSMMNILPSSSPHLSSQICRLV